MGRPLSDVHRDQPVLTAGAALEQAHTAVVACHGRGADARDILGVATELGVDGIAYLAPQAAGNSWYPSRFIAPIEQNEPYLTSALDTIGRVLEYLSGRGLPPARTVLLGFSQGACLTLEYAARHPADILGRLGARVELRFYPSMPHTVTEEEIEAARAILQED